MSNNPFAGFGKVVGGERMAGRQVELEDIFSRLASHSGSLAVVGIPRIGKTSLVREVLNRLERTTNRVARLWIDLSTISDSLSLFNTLRDEFSTTVAELLPNPIEVTIGPILAEHRDSYEGYRALKRLLVRAAARGLKFQLFIDEFDSIRGFPDAQSTIQRLRDLVYYQEETELCGIFIARRSLRVLEMSIADVSTLDGVCEQHYIHPLRPSGLADLIERSAREGWRVSEGDGHRLQFYSGGHPFIAEMILCKSWLHRSVDVGLEECVGDVFDYYEHLRRILEEDDLFDQLLQIAVGPRLSVRAGSLERLLRYGVIRAAEQGGAYTGWSAHFQEYLEKCVRDAPLVSLWKETEISLRGLVSTVYLKRLGDNWIAILRGKHKNLDKVVERCIEMMNKELKNFGHNASVTFLDYSYPMELWEFIAAEWQIFREVLGQTKDYWNQRFTHLAKVRTPTAHSRDIVLAPHEIKLAEAYCHELILKVGAASI